jgi:hypothetical protein
VSSQSLLLFAFLVAGSAMVVVGEILQRRKERKRGGGDA